MSWDWKYWLVKCLNCEWFRQVFPPDQLFDKEISDELRKELCPKCYGHLRVSWKG